MIILVAIIWKFISSCAQNIFFTSKISSLIPLMKEEVVQPIENDWKIFFARHWFCPSSDHNRSSWRWRSCDKSEGLYWWVVCFLLCVIFIVFTSAFFQIANTVCRCCLNLILSIQITFCASDAGTCDSVSSSTTCGDDASSYYEEFTYNGKRVIISNQVGAIVEDCQKCSTCP